jgi:hypothetical protein
MNKLRYREKLNKSLKVTQPEAAEDSKPSNMAPESALLTTCLSGCCWEPLSSSEYQGVCCSGYGQLWQGLEQWYLEYGSLQFRHGFSFWAAQSPQEVAPEKFSLKARETA